MDHPELVARLALAALVTIAAARAGGAAARRVGQPAVIGEICAGIALGPSVLGVLVPGGVEALFPADVRPALALLADAGLTAFMFGVGLELQLGRLPRGRVVPATSAAGLLVPLALGVPAALVLAPAFAGAEGSTAAFVAFLCLALSVTAFPVLARILDDAGLRERPLGTTALACAATTDAAAWCALLAVAAVVAQSGAGGALTAPALAAAYVAGALLVGGPLLRAAAGRLDRAGRPGAAVVAGLLAAFGLAALAAQAGVPALAGGFLAGFALRGVGGAWRRRAARAGALNRVALLPMFFALIGLHTDLRGVPGEPALLAAGGLCLAVTLAGKLGACAAAARLRGLRWRESLGLGVLMSTRGLTEIVVLKAGLDLGVINPDAFAVLEVVALAATAMALPALRGLGLALPPRRAGPAPAAAPVVPAPALPVGRPAAVAVPAPSSPSRA
ncbi:MAG TPA: cation:proton antiporter [Solirubrobacteraceae bacterium]|jgi:Kef-type K+ transport system membrane component KefB|nr:cation:proton antiporter [Solirubrobacteraceae bacterium]